jgi:D-erythritol 1-phosphate dehydrogenase
MLNPKPPDSSTTIILLAIFLFNIDALCAYWKPMKTDIIILGAGINGVGIAREASLRGYSVALLEKNTVGSGTSSKSSRLIHGGLRYLETANFKLVYEALHDRQHLVQSYPELVTLQRFYYPVIKNGPRWPSIIEIGLQLYDILSGFRGIPKYKKIKKWRFAEMFRIVDITKMRVIFSYVDGKTNDLALTKRLATEATEMGTQLFENTVIQDIKQTPDGYRVQTETEIFEAPILINVTGPWIDEVNATFDLPANFKIKKVSGIHLFVDGVLTPSPLFLQTGTDRIFFIIPEPENNQTLIGTTEREESNPVDDIKINEEDIQYLLSETNRYLNPKDQIKREDVRDSQIGVRALVGDAKTMTKISREYKLDLHKNGNASLLHVFGGKLTTFRSLSFKALKKLGLKENF